MALILLTNDDGISAEGLRRLEEFLQGVAEIIVVAPDRERSAVSHGLTIHSPLEITELDYRHYALNGTPVDCILHALRHLTSTPPDLVISGINHGANLGDDIMYSGTVAAAREASRHGIPALAVSQAYDDKPVRFHEGARFVRSLAKSLLLKKPAAGTCLNINVPIGDIRGVRITRQGSALRFPHFNVMDGGSRGAESGQSAEKALQSDLPMDFHVVVERCISITPLQRDQTDYAAAQALKQEMPQMLQGRRIPRMGLIK